jgi:hypothetical protein
VAASLVVCGAAAAGPTWHARVALSAPPLAVEPEVAISRGGEAVVVWDREEGPVCASAPDNPACIHVLEARSRPSGAWEPPVVLMRPGVGPGPRVAVNGKGDAIVVWRHDIGEPRVLQAAWRPGTSRQWQEPIDLSGAGPIGGQDVGIDEAGNAIAVWTIDLGGGLIAQAELRPFLSGSWGAPVTLSRAGETAVGAPSLAVNGAGDAVAVWTRNGGVVQAASRPAGTGAWQPAVDVGGGREPQVVLDPAGNPVAVWSVPGGGVQGSIRTVGGGWTSPVDVSRGAATAPRLGIDDGGNAVALWLSPPGPHVRSARRAAATGVWSQPVAVSVSGLAASEPDVAVDARGNAVAVWTHGSAPTMRAALRPAAAAAWLPGVGLSAAGVTTGDPRVAIDAAGRALALWTRRSVGESVVESTELAGAGPVFWGLTIPTKRPTRRPVQFSVRSTAWAAPVVGQPLWRFGDNTSASGQNVTHTYAARGMFTVTVIHTDAAGGTTSATGRIKLVAVLNTVLPTITRTGNTLSCTTGTWSGVMPITYAWHWRRNGRLVSAATASTYVVGASDAGKQLVCSVTATNSVGSTTVVSAPVRVR